MKREKETRLQLNASKKNISLQIKCDYQFDRIEQDRIRSINTQQDRIFSSDVPLQ
jgi:hypothetical protein